MRALWSTRRAARMRAASNGSAGRGNRWGCSAAKSSPTVLVRWPIRRASSAASAACKCWLSSPIVATTGMGTRCRRRKRPPSPSTPPFSWAPLLAGQAEERVEAVVAAQRDEPLVLDAVAALQDPRHRRLEVVVAHPAGHATEVGEAQHVTLEECLLRLGREHLMERPARGAQPHREQPQLGQRPPL